MDPWFALPAEPGADLDPHLLLLLLLLLFALVPGLIFLGLKIDLPWR